ncbi:HesA/MoeB/ThiF family protein [Domibacillus epiphyticus]|uniref:Thiamine biosynthesis protein ThiF n=1 Tax=Domibacillus epiphyticus TaxID=1714355 RepID=A0A1V2AD38_9BACI|nr:ThiF family adenylyltransferase [Domibacillus epiphyticus]OMP68714.1 thiamine biosynthesis protein ThiF [Domibacillus epiphyticus]
MLNRVKLRLTGRQHSSLYNHLFPGDGLEAVAFALCGITERQVETSTQRVLSIHRIYKIPHEECSIRTESRVKWPTEYIIPLIDEAIRKKMVLLKIHSHPNGLMQFSKYDDLSDKELFPRIADRLETEFPGVSAIMVSDGTILARSWDAIGNTQPVHSISIAGDDIKIWPAIQKEPATIPAFMKRTGQAFGKGTTEILKTLSIGVVGVSGTGSPTAEMLYRLGVGELVLVDDDIVKDINVGRIYNSTIADAEAKRYKVELMADALERIGLPTKIVPICKNLYYPEVIQLLAQCDIIFGCMDSVEGRDTLNRLCVYYNIPYFDLGVKIKANGYGGVDQVCGTVHYLQPDGSSLSSRKVYTPDKLRTENMKRKNPDLYLQLLEDKYIEGANEESPAVISVNTLVSSLAVNELLCRIHPIRDDPNDNKKITSITVSLTQTRLVTDNEKEPCPVLSHYAGRGNILPLLGLQELAERNNT